MNLKGLVSSKNTQTTLHYGFNGLNENMKIYSVKVGRTQHTPETHTHLLILLLDSVCVCVFCTGVLAELCESTFVLFSRVAAAARHCGRQKQGLGRSPGETLHRC